MIRSKFFPDNISKNVSILNLPISEFNPPLQLSHLLNCFEIALNSDEE